MVSAEKRIYQIFAAMRTVNQLRAGSVCFTVEANLSGNQTLTA
jgi:hypothetical protein